MISKLEKKLKNLVFDLPNENLPQAAILILLIENKNGLSIVFTERSKSLPSHAGEVSFPGGKREAEDEDLIETALRETQEEIGINPKQINILGRMDTKESRFGLSVSPFIGYAPGNLEFIKEGEIDDVQEYFFDNSIDIINYPDVDAVRIDKGGDTIAEWAGPEFVLKEDEDGVLYYEVTIESWSIFE